VCGVTTKWQIDKLTKCLVDKKANGKMTNGKMKNGKLTKVANEKMVS